MAIEVAGKKPVGTLKLKIDNQSTIDLPKGTEETIQNILDFLPTEHIRGLDRIKIVDFINTSALKNISQPISGDLPGLYYPKQINQSAYLEISAGALLQPTEGFAKKMMAKSAFKGNLAGLWFSLVAQHYYLTLRHSVKKQNLEPQIRQYAEKNMKAWSAKQNTNSFRAKLFKPLQPMFERLAKWLNKKAAAAQKKS
jgi:hypothetical protein